MEEEYQALRRSVDALASEVEALRVALDYMAPVSGQRPTTLDDAIRRMIEVLDSAGGAGVSLSEVRKSRFQSDQMPLVVEAARVAVKRGAVARHPSKPNRYVLPS